MFVSYLRQNLIFDLKAGFITAIVALPLAIGFAIASGVHPIMGLYTAVIAGLLGSSFGGSKFSITGPTGAMTVLILSTVNKFGIEGLLLAGFLAGAMQLSFGLLKLGKFVKFIPLPVISGLTAGIGVIIFAGQIPAFLGLSIPPKEFIGETFIEIASHSVSSNSVAIAIGACTLALLFLLPKLFAKSRKLKSIPPSIIALIGSTALVYLLNLSVPLVGDIPSGLPQFNLLNFNVELLRSILPAAFAIALLGTVESLLCAVVCDGMSGTKHRSNRELIAQGLANITLPFLGGIPATAALARSAINIREGARTRIAGIVHALILLSIIIAFGSLVAHVPRAFLAGILFFVSLRMINIQEFKTITKISKQDSMVLFATFILTIFTDLVFAIEVGMFLAILLMFVRFTSILKVIPMEEYDDTTGINARIAKSRKLKDKVSVYTLHGPFFFGAMSVFEQKMKEHLNESKPVIILRMKHVPMIDSTGIERLKSFIKDTHKSRGHVILTRLNPQVRKDLEKDHEFTELMKAEKTFESTSEALDYIEKSFKATRK